MSNAVLAPIEAAKNRADLARILQPKRLAGTRTADLLHRAGAAGNMAIQRAASGALAHNPAAPAILGGANMSSSPCSCGGTCEECKKKQVQRKGEAGVRSIPSTFEDALARSGGGMPLARHTRDTMENHFGERFDDVRIHDDSSAAEAARHVKAHAFTSGRDVYFGAGRYDPHSTGGQKLIAHELTHVLQQRRGVVPPGMKSLNATAHDDVFEHEAEEVEATFEKDAHGESPLRGHAHESAGHSHGDHIQRKCSCGGSCPKCAGENAAPAPPQEIKKPPLQRKCDAGATCAKVPEEETKVVMVQRKADYVPESPRDRLGTAPHPFMHPIGDKKNKREIGNRNSPGHSRAPSGVRPPNRVASSSTQGRPTRPGQLGRNAIPRLQRSPSSNTTTQDHKLEREADSAANDLTSGRQLSSDKLSAADQPTIQRLPWEWCNPFTDPDCGLSSTAHVVSGEVQEVASEVWDAASELADAVGGFLSYVNNLLTITIPPKHVLDAYSVRFSLPEIGIDFPFLEGAIPLGEVALLYGELGLHLGFTPEISLQLGPADTHEITIALHPLTLSGSASGGLDLTVGAGLGALATAGIYGEIGVKVLWPDPPLVVQVPIARLEAGLAGFIRGIAANHFSFDVSASAGLTGFDFDLDTHSDLGLALDLGLAGFGSLSVLGVNLCTLFWPLYQKHLDTVLSLGLSLGLNISVDSLPSLSIDPEMPEFNSMDWGDLGIEIQRDMFKDDCPLCQFLYDLGLMPSQRGGGWTGHPKSKWPVGPLAVFPRDPGIKSGALCRGACGPDCDTCANEKERRVCEETPDGCHVWWVYPNYSVCGSHSGCRNHDACYDWCVDKYNEKGKLGIILGPCHRLCDFECICDYNTPQCVGWIGGGKPHDSYMEFSDKPYQEPGCHGPCPHEVKTSSGGVQQRLCLENITIVDRRSLFHKGFRHSTGDITILSVPLEIPYIPPPTLDVFVRGEVSGSADAGIGPVTLEGLCLIYDPASHGYAGTGSIHLKGDLNGRLNLTGILGAKAGWGCLLNAIDLEVIRGEAGLSATGLAHLPLDLSATAKVSCRHGKLMLDLGAFFKACLDLRFKLDALLKVMLFKRFEVFSDSWNLVDRRWGHCWDIPLGVTSGEIASTSCGAGTAGAFGLGSGAPAGPPPALTVGSAGAAGAAAGGATGAAAPATPAAAPGFAHATLGNIDSLSVRSLVTDLFNLAAGKEVIHDRSNGGLPADPAKEAGKSNPCGDVKPDDQCGSKDLPRTQVSFFPGPLGQGGRVKASPLTRCEGNTVGSEPDNSIYKTQFDCIKAAGELGSWVRAHILHGKTSSSGARNLHGPGDDIRNLIISDKSLNGTMRTGAEGPALDIVYGTGNRAIWYDSRVDSYVPGLEFFAESITVDFGSFDTATNTEGPRIGGGTFTRKRTPPNCPSTASAAAAVPAAVLGGSDDECANPLNNLNFEVTLNGQKRVVNTKDVKHTRMAKKTLDRILHVAGQSSNCDDQSLSVCERGFCNAVKDSDKKKFGGQIDSNTRADAVYEGLLIDAWQNKKPPASGEWTEFGAADDSVGFDMGSKAATNAYTVHTNVTKGGKVFTDTHLFPGGS